MARRRTPARPSPPLARPHRAAGAWIVFVLAIAIVALAAWWWRRPVPSGAIVLVSIDTLRADHLPMYGYRAGQTPTLDALALESVVFDKAYAHAPQTLPSHASMLTAAAAEGGGGAMRRFAGATRRRS